MKKWVAVLAVLAMMFSLAACSEPSSTYTGTDEELDTILGGIASIPIATMGVSMVITARSVELLDWCAASTMDADGLAAAVKVYYDELDGDAKDMFIEQVAVVINSVGVLSREESRALTLETAGFSAKLTWEEDVFSLAASIDDQL